MSIRFKFRSSVSFDSIDIEGRSSISVRDLRSKIVRNKNLNFCQDFDLVFSDALTGREFNDEKFQIPSGSSVIIKRVPAGTVPSALAPIDSLENFRMKDSNPFSPMCGQVDDFDDFGVDLCPAPEATLPDSDLEFDKNGISNEKANIAASRLGCPNLEASDLSEAIPRGSFHSGAEGNIPQKKLESKVEEHMKLDKVVGANYLAVQNANLPSELKCPLCNTFFKEAVMIPCCQHSFCGKCIRVILIEKARCPKCSSTKCRVDDLLPNLSLRQAIEHFLESQNLITGSDNALREYAPDGESGIQARDVTCAVNIVQKEVDLPLSPSATGKGSNQIMEGSFYESRVRKNASLEGSGYHSNLGSGKALKSATSSHKVKQIDGYAHHVDFRSGPEDFSAVADFQGGNRPFNLPRTHAHENADSNISKKRGAWIDNGGGGRSFMATGRHRMADRTCYMCGSPEHFIRDCPVASSQHSMLQTGNPMFPGGMPGYAPPYWNGAAFAPMRPFANMYGNPGMMPFNPTMVPVTPFAVPPYVPSMYSSLPSPGGIMRMGGLPTPTGTKAERPVSRSEFLELRNCENRGKLLNENLERRQPYDDQDDYFHPSYRYNESERSQEYKSHTERDKSVSHSGDSLSRRSRRKHQHDKHLDHDIQSVDEKHEKNLRSSTAGRERRPYHSEKSNSGLDDRSNSCERYGEERHKQHHRSSKKHHHRREQCGSDSSWSHHQSRKEIDVKGRVESVIEGSNRKHPRHLESGLDPRSSGDQKKQFKEKDCSRSSRHSRDSAKPNSDELCNDRWQMASSSDEDYREGYRCPKRKRILENKSEAGLLK